MNVFDESLKPHLGKPLQRSGMRTSSGNVSDAFFAAPPVYVGKLRLPVDRPVGCIDMSRLCQVIGRDVYGVLGASFHENAIVQIDFDEGKLLILAGHPLREDDEWGQSLRLVHDPWKLPWLIASFGGEERERFMIDTGCSGTGSLSQDLLDRLVASSRFRLTGDTQVERLSGTSRVVAGRLDGFSVGPFCHRDLIFRSARHNKIGLGYLSRYRVTFDFVAEKIYLKKGKRFSAPDRADMSGLHVLRKSQQIEVESIDRGSPADKAGIQPKDVIIEFQGRQASNLDLFDIRRGLGSGDRESVTLVIDRAGKEIQVTFQLREKRPQSNASEPE